MDDIRQRWVFLWRSHILNRYFSKCLSVNVFLNAPETSFKSGYAVLSVPCVESDTRQKWSISKRFNGRNYFYVDLCNFICTWTKKIH